MEAIGPLMRRRHPDSCFGCGSANIDGLRLAFERGGEGTIRTTFVARPKYEGPPGILHGGIIALIFDELSAALSVRGRGPSFTARLSVRFLKPVFTGEEITFEARLDKEKGGFAEVSGEALDKGGLPVANYTALIKLVGELEDTD